MPVIAGSTTQSTATAATAASAAVPPAFSVSIAARLASGCEVAAIPSRAIDGRAAGQMEIAGFHVGRHVAGARR